MTTVDAASHPSSPLVLLAGGGSGGHVFPALAVGEELVRRGWRMSATGSLHGLEAELYADRGVPFYGLPARPVVGRGPLQRLVALATLARSTARAAGLVRRLDPRVVVATGGYAAAPAMLAGRLCRRPVLLVEPNAHAGAASRWLSRCCREAAVAHAAAARELACPSRVTGVPVRAAFAVDPSPLPSAPPYRLLVLGGSQGAAGLNAILPAAVARAARQLAAPLAVVHQTGGRHLASAQAAWALERAAEPGAAVEATATAFLADVATTMAASHLVVSRAGAITLAEIAAAGRPSLLLPLGLAGGHQVDNARAVAAAGAAACLEPSQLAGADAADRLAQAIVSLLADRDRLATMAAAARASAHPDAAARIADRVEAFVGIADPGGAR